MMIFLNDDDADLLNGDPLNDDDADLLNDDADLFE